SRRRHTRSDRDWSSDVCSSDLTLVIADPRGGSFAPEDLRLLSTVATHAAVVIANARFFEMVQHAKEQWETAFDALSEGIGVVDRSEERRVGKECRCRWETSSKK